MRALGLIAAAGRSSRMGRPKALVEIAGESFVERLVGALLAGGVARVAITIPEPPDDGPVRDHLAARFGDEARIAVVRNAFPAEGLSGSVRTAIAIAGDADALVMTPVDAPFATGALVHALLAAIDRGATAAVPVVEGRMGHPVAFARAAFERLSDADARGGPRGVLDALGEEVARVVWEDARVTLNVNTPEALAQASRLR